MKLMDKIRNAVNMTDETYTDEAVFDSIAEMTEYVYTKKLDILEKNDTGNINTWTGALDLVAEKERVDKYFALLKNQAMFEDVEFKGTSKAKFMYKLYMMLEEYEKVSALKDFV